MLIEEVAEKSRTHRQNSGQTVRKPAHSGLFGTGADHGITSGFGNPTAQMNALRAKRWVLHAMGIVAKILRFDVLHALCFPRFWGERGQALDGRDDLVDLT